MTIPKPDTRSDARKRLDDQLAAEPLLPAPELATDSPPRPMEEHLGSLRKRPLALMGIVENGQVRLLDPQVKLPEQSRVIVVTSYPA